MIGYKYSIQSKIGGRAEQQDFYGSLETKQGLLIVVCDGMGGTNGGATASTMAVNIIMDTIAKDNFSSPEHALYEAFHKANKIIYERAQTQEVLSGMGTTAVAIILNDNTATAVDIGDSRFYEVRNKAGNGCNVGKIIRTDDHSKVIDLVKKGVMSEEETGLSAESNIINRALGLRPQAEIEIHKNIKLSKKDRLL